MTARSTIFGEEGTEFLRRMADFGAGLRACFEGSGFACFTGLGPALPVLAAGKPGIAQQLYRGIFAFAGHTIDCQPAQVFSILPPSAAWADRLHGFAWLAHLEAPGLALYRNFARCLIQNWAGRRLRSSFEASCRRLISLSLHSGFLLKDSSPCFQAQFLALVSRETLRLAKLRPRTPAAQLRQSIAVLTAGLAFRGGGTLRNDALARTAALMTAFVLPDGGLADRSPKSLLDLLSDLVPLRAALEDQRIAIPRELNAAIERAIPMLRMLCHGDGGLAVFHGVEHTNPAGVRAIFERDGVLGRPHSHAVYSGYCRMNQGHSTVIVDCGPPSICDSGLAFEFSEGPQRIVGSCGVPANASPAWRAAAQSPAAHSTLQWEDKPAQNIQSILGRKMRRAKPAPIAELAISNHGTLFKAGNASPATGLGHLHVRELFLASGGHDFRGEDYFERIEPGAPALNFAIRFHLHPSVKASADRKGAAIMLLLPNKDAWQFSALGGVMTLEESIYLAGGVGPRHSLQIVIRGSIESSNRINWAFKKRERQARHNGSAAAAPRLPF